MDSVSGSASWAVRIRTCAYATFFTFVRSPACVPLGFNKLSWFPCDPFFCALESSWWL